MTGVHLAPGAAVVAFAVVFVAVAGCLAEGDLEELERVFGARNLRWTGTEYAIRSAVLEGSFGTHWDLLVFAEVQVPPLDLSTAKTDPGPSGGGGTSRSLDLVGTAVTFQARLKPAIHMANLTVSWGIVDSNGTVASWTERSSEPVSPPFPMAQAGWIDVAARFHDSQGRVAFAAPTTGVLSAHWVVHSAVRPVAPVPAARPPHYDTMADLLTVPNAGQATYLRATTEFRGGYEPGMGTDVDLEVRSPGGVSQCKGEGGGPTPGPEAASESVNQAPAAPGSWLVRVGSVTCDTHTFANPGMVPYTVKIDLVYEALTGPGVVF